MSMLNRLSAPSCAGSDVALPADLAPLTAFKMQLTRKSFDLFDLAHRKLFYAASLRPVTES